MDYILGICSSDGDGVWVEAIRGEEQDVLEYMVKLIIDDRDTDRINFDFGTDSVKELRYRSSTKSWYGFNAFLDHHVDFELHPMKDIVWTDLGGDMNG